MIREMIDTRPMSRYQLRVVAFCCILAAAEGYDILVMSFAASGAAAEWGLSSSQLGLLLSSGLIGMAVGSAVLAPLADRIGRRRLSLFCLLAINAGMTIGTFSADAVQLGTARVLTGLGIGGLAAGLPVLVAEFTPQARRTTMIALLTTGTPLGGVVGGLVATSTSGWRALFAVGMGLTLLMMVSALWLMPESLEYLAAKNPPRALERINGLLPRLGLAPLAAMPVADSAAAARTGTLRAIFSGRTGVLTALLWLAFFIVTASYYFAASWTPRLLVESGLTKGQAAAGGLLLSLGGVIATVGFALLALKADKRRLTSAGFVGCAIAFVAVSAATHGGLVGVLVTTTFLGLFLNTAGAGMYTIAPDIYPANVRATAMGWAATAARIGGILAPTLVGVLIDLQWTPRMLFLLFAVPTLVAAIAVVVRTRPSNPVAATPPSGTPSEIASSAETSSS